MSAQEEVYATLLRGQKCRYEGYPEWYQEELLKNEPIQIDKFDGKYEQAVNFYFKETSKLHFANTVLSTQLKAALAEKQQLADLIAALEESQKESMEEKKKRIRRCASQIERKYVCQVANCQKSYGTQGSMAQHMRLKHPEIDYNPLQWLPEQREVPEKKTRTRVKQETN